MAANHGSICLAGDQALGAAHKGKIGELMLLENNNFKLITFKKKKKKVEALGHCASSLNDLPSHDPHGSPSNLSILFFGHDTL